MNRIYDELKNILIKMDLEEYEDATDMIQQLKTYVFMKRSKNTKCPYCNSVVPYNESGLLCEECREDFGHSLMEEL